MFSRDIVEMTWTPVAFGKYRGKTLPQIAFSDPDYLYWAMKEGVFSSKQIAAEAKDVARKAQRIAVPDHYNAGKKVRYYIDRTRGKLGNVEVIDAGRGPHSGSSSVVDKEFFDLFSASKISSYDKTGGRFVVNSIKYHVFGNSKARLTKSKVEAFFEDSANFI